MFILSVHLKMDILNSKGSPTLREFQAFIHDYSSHNYPRTLMGNSNF